MSPASDQSQDTGCLDSMIRYLPTMLSGSLVESVAL